MIIVVVFDSDDDHGDVDDNDIANYKMIICNYDYIGIIIYDIVMLLYWNYYIMLLLYWNYYIMMIVKAMMI